MTNMVQNSTQQLEAPSDRPLCWVALRLRVAACSVIRPLTYRPGRPIEIIMEQEKESAWNIGYWGGRDYGSVKYR